MTDDRTLKQQTDPKDIDKAWRYHRDADELFHSRLTSFVTSQSFLITGYMVSFLIPKEFPDLYSVLVRLPVALLGIMYSISFYLVCNWLYLGMQQLKRKYLTGERFEDKTGDPIYKEYYF